MRQGNFHHIINHFWYSCQNCDKDPVTLVERFHSILLHIINRHAWSEDPLSDYKKSKKSKKGKPTYPVFSKIRKCSHSRAIRHRRKRGLLWLDGQSEEYRALFKLLTDTRASNAMQK